MRSLFPSSVMIYHPYIFVHFRDMIFPLNLIFHSMWIAMKIGSYRRIPVYRQSYILKLSSQFVCSRSFKNGVVPQEIAWSFVVSHGVEAHWTSRHFMHGSRYWWSACVAYFKKASQPHAHPLSSLTYHQVGRQIYVETILLPTLPLASCGGNENMGSIILSENMDDQEAMTEWGERKTHVQTVGYFLF